MEKTMYRDLYSDEDIKVMKVAEDSLNPKVDRVDEIIAYCREAGIRNIGIANCISFEKQAERLQDILTSNGFTVEKANCKLGRVKFDELVPGYKGVSCNPAGQANYLDEKKTELNIMMGLCLGHDIIFNARSKAPVTSLVVKDRKLDHHTLSMLKRDQNKKQ